MKKSIVAAILGLTLASSLEASSFTTNLVQVKGEILSAPGQSPACWTPGTVTLTNDISGCHPLWTNPANSSDDPFYAVNSFANGQPTQLTFEYETEANTLYSISGWIASLYRAIDGSVTNLDFLINGIVMGNAFPSGVGEVNPYTFNWFSGTSRSLQVQLRTNSSVYDGGDWAAIEPDVEAVPTPEPTSMLLLGTGLLTMGNAARKRRIKDQAKTSNL